MSDVNNNNSSSLTHQHLKGAECPEDEDRITVRDEVVSGFLARVYPSGKKSFHVRYRIHGKHKCPKIGEFSQMSLREAREKAMEMKVEVSQGSDPMRETMDKFEDLIDDYLQNHFLTLADATQRDTKRNINEHIRPALGGKSPDDITPNDVRDLMDKVVKEARAGDKVGDGPTAGHHTANKVKNALSSIFFNTRHNYGNPCLKVKPLPTVDVDPEEDCLNDEQIQRLWSALETEPLISGSLIKMLLITGQRIKEAKKMKWEDISEGIWTLPASITKNNEAHLLPLPTLAKGVLNDLQPETGDSEYVFQSPSPMNDGHVSSLSRSRKRIREKANFKNGEFKLKSLRTTVRTNLSRLKVPKSLGDRVLNHAIDDVSDRHYDAHYYIDKKREALEKWSDKLQEIIDQE